MDQFDEMDNATMVCAVCEAMCPEAVDGTLTAAEQKAFDKHVAGCVACTKELAEAHRGAAWMQMLKGHKPEPPAALLHRILAETTGAVAAQAVAAPTVLVPAYQVPAFVPAARPSGWSVQWASFRERLSETFSLQQMSFQPRLAMTAAMAFFSIALTLNLTGVRVKDFRAEMLRPSSLQRSVADATASATRSFQNLRVVYEFESRVSDMRNNGDLGGRYSNDSKDPAGPFQSGPADQKDANPGSTVPNTTAPGTTQEQNKQDKQVPQGKSELLFPLKPGTPVEKGA